jgi:hypothetical protein
MKEYCIVRWIDSPKVHVTNKTYTNALDASQARDEFIFNFKKYHNKDLNDKLEIVQITEKVVS